MFEIQMQLDGLGARQADARKTTTITGRDLLVINFNVTRVLFQLTAAANLLVVVDGMIMLPVADVSVSIANCSCRAG